MTQSTMKGGNYTRTVTRNCHLCISLSNLARTLLGGGMIMAGFRRVLLATQIIN